MKWLKCICWLAAWGVWVWLGFGLHRELPRTLAPAMCKLPTVQGDALLGFVGETDQVAFLQGVGNTLTHVRVYNAVDGSLIRNTRGPAATAYTYLPLTNGDPGVLFANEAPTAGDRDLVPGLHRLDLDVGEWRRYSDLVGGAFPALDMRSGVAVWVRSGRPANQVVFLDLKTGAELAVCTFPPGWSYIGPPHVASDVGLAVLPMAVWPKGAATAERMTLEVWRLGPPPRMERSIDVTGHGQWMTVSSDGRAALSRVGEPTSLDVYDIVDGSLVYSGPPSPSADPSPNTGGISQPILSPSGRTAFDGGWSSLWDLHANRLLWRQKPHETPLSGRDRQFVIAEEWSVVWKKWLPTLRVETKACRDVETGFLIHRVAAGYDALPIRWNADHSLSVSLNGTVYGQAPAVNWPLFVFCHAVLALPLILLWSLLRWRRRRAARRQPAVATDVTVS